MSDAIPQFLHDLLLAPGPSSYEHEAAKVWRKEAAAFARVWSDAPGNSFAEVNPGASPRIALYGHVDELGFVVSDLDERGMLRIEPLGSWSTIAAIGQRLTVLTAAGPIPGIVGRRWNFSPDELEAGRQPRFDELWADVGASDRAQAAALVEIGDPIVTVGPPVALPGGRIMSRALDDRLGAFAVLEMARALAGVEDAPNVVAVATVQEETSLLGAVAATAALAPDIVLAVDVCDATDVPVRESAAGYETGYDSNRHPLGAGPGISRGSVVTAAVADALRASAETLGVAYRLRATARRSATDLDGVARSGRAPACGLLSIPTRYLHTPSEVAQLSDVADAVAIGVELARTHAAGLVEGER